MIATNHQNAHRQLNLHIVILSLHELIHSACCARAEFTHLSSVQSTPAVSILVVSLIQELVNLECKPRMGFHHLEKGRAVSSSPHSDGVTPILEQLPKPGFEGDSMYRRRYLQGKGIQFEKPFVL